MFKHSSSRLRYVILAAAAALLAGSRADAYEFISDNNCSSYHWTNDPLFHINEVSFPTTAKKKAIYEVGNTIEQIGGSAFDLTWSYDGSMDLNFNNNRNDVYLASLSNWNLGRYSGWARSSKNTSNCTFKQVDVIFDADDPWVYLTPADHGKNYWRTGLRGGPNNTMYLRMTAIHEFLHTAGLSHEDNVWSQMNYVNRPWRTESSELQMSPLPDDRRAVRQLYPAGTYEENVAVVTTYADFSKVSSTGAATGRLLCEAAAGSGYSAGIFDAFCANSNVLHVCPGDLIYTRFTLVNDSTIPATVEKHLYFSTDAVLSWNDAMSSTTSSRTLQPGTHFREWGTYSVPWDLFPGQVYYLIAALESDLTHDRSASDNWIPLNSTLVMASTSCP